MVPAEGPPPQKEMTKHTVKRHRLICLKKRFSSNADHYILLYRYTA
jgi:hypothetical protein